MRNNKEQLFTTSLLAATVFFVIPLRTHAYINPGLGGQAFQAFYLISIGLLAFLVSPILFFWKRIHTWLRKSRQAEKTPEEDAN